MELTAFIQKAWRVGPRWSMAQHMLSSHALLLFYTYREVIRANVTYIISILFNIEEYVYLHIDVSYDSEKQPKTCH